jgi:hypothetical protein
MTLVIFTRAVEKNRSESQHTVHAVECIGGFMEDLNFIFISFHDLLGLLE